MKNFKSWGTKVRKMPEFNYHAVWHNLKTIRLGSGVAKDLPYDRKEFYDVGLGTYCDGGCTMCYVSATTKGKQYENIVEKAEYFFGNMKPEERPFQIAIGSSSEPTTHRDFIPFMEAVYNLGIVPNFTTNGKAIAQDDQRSKDIIDAAQKLCGGVAISVNSHLPWERAVEKLVEAGDVNINLHYIISNKESVDEFLKIWNKWKDDILYFVLLPLMPSGRSTQKYDSEAFDYLLELFPEEARSKLAFGAHFYDDLVANKDKIKTWSYPPESMSANINFDSPITITKSSFDKEPVITIKY